MLPTVCSLDTIVKWCFRIRKQSVYCRCKLDLALSSLRYLFLFFFTHILRRFVENIDSNKVKGRRRNQRSHILWSYCPINFIKLNDSDLLRKNVSHATSYHSNQIKAFPNNLHLLRIIWAKSHLSVPVNTSLTLNFIMFLIVFYSISWENVLSNRRRWNQ